MPNRILRDTTDSDAVNSLNEAEEVFFYRLLMKADDFGRYHANPKLLRSLLYPLRDGLRDTDITRRLAAAQSAGLIAVYETTHTGATRWLSADELAAACAVNQKRFLVIPKFNQRTRASVSKFPQPPDDGLPSAVHVPVTCQTNDGHMSDTRQTHAHGDEDVFGDEVEGGDADEDGAVGGVAPAETIVEPSGQTLNLSVEEFNFVTAWNALPRGVRGVIPVNGSHLPVNARRPFQDTRRDAVRWPAILSAMDRIRDATAYVFDMPPLDVEVFLKSSEPDKIVSGERSREQKRTSRSRGSAAKVRSSTSKTERAKPTADTAEALAELSNWGVSQCNVADGGSIASLLSSVGAQSSNG